MPRRIVRGTRIQPFGDLVDQLPLVGRPLSVLQAEELADAQRPADSFLFTDYSLATSPILRAFFDAAPRGAPARLALPSGSASIAPWAPVSSIPEHEGACLLDVFLYPDTDDLEALRDRSTPILVDPKPATERRELPRVGPAPHHLELPIDGAVAGHVEHWLHLLWLAPMLVPALLRRMLPNHRARRDLAASVIGQGAQIHPTAHIEGSIVGSGVEIGAFCSVRHSYVGPGSRLADFTKVTRSVLEAETRTLADASFSSVVALGDSTLASLLLRDTILGRQVFLTTGVIFWNESIEDTVRVEHGGQLVDTGRKLLGGCAGHGCSLGARTIVAPGQALPNRTVVVMRREEGVLRVEPVAPGTPVCWDEAALVPYDRLRPGETPDELLPSEPR